MTTTTYNIMVDGEKVATMSGDFAQASSSLLLDGESTPFQVADARHKKVDAAEMLLKWAASQGGAIVDTNEDGDLIYDEICVVIPNEKLEVGDRVESGDGDEHDTGRVDEISDGKATVSWDSLVVTTQPVSMLRKI